MLFSLHHSTLGPYHLPLRINYCLVYVLHTPHLSVWIFISCLPCNPGKGVFLPCNITHSETRRDFCVLLIFVRLVVWFDCVVWLSQLHEKCHIALFPLKYNYIRPLSPIHPTGWKNQPQSTLELSAPPLVKVSRFSQSKTLREAVQPLLSMGSSDLPSVKPSGHLEDEGERPPRRKRRVFWEPFDNSALPGSLLMPKR